METNTTQTGATLLMRQHVHASPKIEHAEVEVNMVRQIRCLKLSEHLWVDLDLARCRRLGGMMTSNVDIT